MALVWLIAAVSVIAVLALLRVITPWGRQFWRITGGYFTGRHSIWVWLTLGVLLLSVVVWVRITVLFSYQGKDLNSSVQTAVQGLATGNNTVKQSGMHGFWMSLTIFSLIVVLHVSRYMFDIYLTQRFIVAWRVWLTERLTGDWLEGHAYYRSRFIDHTIRLHGLVVADEQARELPELLVEPSTDGTVDIEDVQVQTPNGDQLIKALDLHLSQGDTLVITGPSGSGKTTLLRSLAQLWPYTSGTFRCPGNSTTTNETMFLSQLPYVPLGDLRAVVSYPSASGDIPDAQLHDVLTTVVLPHLVDRLDELQDWTKVLSPGEQQRIAFARVLLTKPKAVFLDEATSAMDEGLELTMHQLLRNELPNTILVSVSHRSTIEPHHNQRLRLLGQGQWQLGRIEKEPASV